MTPAQHIVASLICATLVGCASSRHHQEESQSSVVAPVQGARLTEAEVVEIALKVAKQAGRRINDYQRPRIKFDSGSNEWWLFYSHKPPGFPGGHFTIVVDDKTREAKLFGGA